MIGHSEFRRSTIRPLQTTLVVFVAAVTLCANISFAQNWPRTDSIEPKPPTAVEKLVKFHQDLKRKITGFGRKTKPDPNKQLVELFAQHRNQPQSLQETQWQTRQEPVSQAGFNQELDPWGQQAGVYRQESNDVRQQPSQDAANYRNENWQQQTSRTGNPNASSPVGIQHFQYGSGQDLPDQRRMNYAENQPQVDQRTIPGAVNSQTRYAETTPLQYGNTHPQGYSGDYRGGHFEQGPATTTNVQEPPQVTASMRAIRLQDENQQLRQQNEAFRARNQQLYDMLRENQLLLEQIESAIDSARVDLENANQKNELLHQQVAALESARKTQELETARLLDSIRLQLNDVVIREITGK